ncbi:adenosine deaminase [Pseudonocardia sp. KRD291]|uniref:adenosine deaminase n=1 Tax=Pseudonocardia sp. KRD291 TaxID=2792007 RepID=UPI001C4A64E1|nr:adenosine deaminase [Pseudonocardia sp. KRD291]MBW0106032.1 adenosine deaminase [Pseudonocardia sp. KRD291]
MLPSAELHLHLEGTLEPSTILELAERNRVRLPYADVDELAARYEFADLQAFLDLYYANMATLRTAQDFADMTDAYLTRAAAAGVVHAEVFVDPQAHTSRGVALSEVLDGVGTALAAAPSVHGISTGLIPCVLRDHSAADAMAMLDGVLRSGAPVLGLGLDSAEVGHPPSAFTEVFDRAGAEGLHRVAHAGEEGPPSYVWEALDLLGAERIDHGVRSLEDGDLVARLVRQRTPLTVCPLSNLRLRVVDDLAEHPLPEMMRRGLVVTVNSDDPAYFGGYLDDNMAALRGSCGIDDDAAEVLARNSVEAAFLDDARKRELLARIDAAVTGARPRN